MDYKKLLKAYMAHVLAFEGSTFAMSDDDRLIPSPFTDEEWQELRRLDAELAAKQDG